jgi:hypothetical protein
MIEPRKKYLYLLLLLTLIKLSSSCTVCQKCINCSSDVLADTYIDGIDALLQKSIQNIGYPISIIRSPNSTSITYQMRYNNGLLVNLLLDLKSMHIQLINYSINSTSSSTTTTSSSSQSQSNSNFRSLDNGYIAID